MSREFETFKVDDNRLIKQQMLNWASQFSICCYLDNQQYKTPYHTFECIVGVGATAIFNPGSSFFSSLSFFLEKHDDWIFGHLNFEAGRASSEQSYSKAPPGFPDCILFVPEVVLILNETGLTIGVLNADAAAIFSQLRQQTILVPNCENIGFTPTISRSQYLDKIEQLKQHVKHGNCYEINFCQEFYATATIDPAGVYSLLSDFSSSPFSAFYRVNENYLLCASPERFLKKDGNQIISQPIKGTSPRNRSDRTEDERNKSELRESAKNKAENVMIVDLVRNDFSKICEEGTVRVDELFAVYSFSHVHQMISTITGVLKKEVDFAQVLQATFPMGSMTGAPKMKVLQLIEEYEEGKRGIYSGTVGYITPEKNFDFNVVIRSIVYNLATQQLSFHTGSAITASSNPEDEYDECLLKGAAIKEVFSGERKA